MTFEYGMNGRLNVTAEVPGTHREIALELERDTTLSEAGLLRWQEVMSQEGGFDVLEAAMEDIAAEREQVPARASTSGAASMSEKGSTWDTSPQKHTPSKGSTPPGGAGSSERWAPPKGAAPHSDTGEALRSAEMSMEKTARPKGLDFRMIVIGYILSAVIGLSLGYIILAFWMPERFPLPW